MKDNFLLKKSQQEVFETLTDEEAGKLIKGIFKYMRTGDSELTGMMKAIFIPIKNDIDKNEETYQKRCEINKQNGSLGGAPKGNQNAKKNKTTENNPKTTENKQKQHDNNHISYITNHNSYIINHKSNNHIDIIKQIIDYLNNKTNSNFKYTSKTTQNKIIARLNEGYVLDDFIVVIDKKFIEWNNTEFEQYLCPETLFGPKFEKYLNQKSTKTGNKPDWLKKDILEDKASDEEIKALEERLKRR